MWNLQYSNDAKEEGQVIKLVLSEFYESHILRRKIPLTEIPRFLNFQQFSLCDSSIHDARANICYSKSNIGIRDNSRNIFFGDVNSNGLKKKYNIPLFFEAIFPLHHSQGLELRDGDSVTRSPLGKLLRVFHFLAKFLEYIARVIAWHVIVKEQLQIGTGATWVC